MKTLPPAIVLAGGFGTRLRSVLPDLPKPLAPIHGVPFVQHLLDYLDAQGVHRVIISVGYKANLIENKFGVKYKNMEILYAREDEPLGTGGAIRHAVQYCHLGPLALVLNGDTYFPIQLHDLSEELCTHSQAHVVIALKQIENANRYGTVSLGSGSRILSFSEKGQQTSGFINGGIYALRTHIFNDMPPDPFSFENSVLTSLSDTGNLLGFPFDSPFIDIGVPEDYFKASQIIPIH